MSASSSRSTRVHPEPPQQQQRHHKQSLSPTKSQQQHNQNNNSNQASPPKSTLTHISIQRSPNSEIESKKCPNLPPPSDDEDAPSSSLSFIRFNYLIIIIAIIQVTICCFVVWYMVYSRASSTVDDLSHALRGKVVSDLVDRVRSQLQLVIKSATTLHEGVDIYLPNYENMTTIMDKDGFMSPISLTLSFYSTLQSVSIANQNGLFLSSSRLPGRTAKQYSIIDSMLLDNPSRNYTRDAYALAIYEWDSRQYFLNASTPRDAAWHSYWEHHYLNSEIVPDTNAYMKGSEILNALGPTTSVISKLYVTQRPPFKRSIELNGKAGFIAPFSLLGPFANLTAIAAVIGHRGQDGNVDRVSISQMTGATWEPTFQTTYVGTHGLILLTFATGRVLATNIPELGSATLTQQQTNVFTSTHPLLQTLAPIFERYSFMSRNTTGLLSGGQYVPSPVTRLPIQYQGYEYELHATYIPVDGFNAFLCVLTTDSDFDGDLPNTQQTTIWIAALVAVVAVVFSALVTHCISRPTARLVAFMEHMSIRLKKTNNNIQEQEKEIDQFVKLWHHDVSEGQEILNISDRQWYEHQKMKSQGEIQNKHIARDCCFHVQSLFHYIYSKLGSLIPIIPMRENQLLHRAFGSMLNGLRASHTHLHNANESKRRFIRYIFHEVRVPFNAIVLGIGQLKEDLYSEPLKPIDEMRDIVNIASEQSSVVARILNDVLSLQKIEDGALKLEFDHFNMIDMICCTIRSFQQSAADKQMTFIVNLDNLDAIVKQYEAQWMEQHQLKVVTSDNIPSPETIPCEGNSQQLISTAPGSSPSTSSASPSPGAVVLSSSVLSGFSDSKQLAALASSSSTKVIGDRYRLRQVLANFLSNAIKFSESGSTITVSLHITLVSPSSSGANSANSDASSLPSSSDCDINDTCPPPMAHMRVAVKDEGRGLTDEEQKQMFKPYIQLSPNEQQQGKGTGLGLNISKSLIELHGGEIGVNSDGVHGHGCEFFFDVPLQVIMNGSNHSDITALPSTTVQSKSASAQCNNSNGNHPSIASDDMHSSFNSVQPTGQATNQTRHNQVGSSIPFSNNPTLASPFQTLNSWSPHPSPSPSIHTLITPQQALPSLARQPTLTSSSNKPPIADSTHGEFAPSDSTFNSSLPLTIRAGSSMDAIHNSDTRSSSPVTVHLDNQSSLSMSSAADTPHRPHSSADSLGFKRIDRVSKPPLPTVNGSESPPSNYTTLYAAPVVKKPSSVSAVSPRVLVVEDSAPNRKLLIMLLKSLGCTSYGAENGLIAVREFSPDAHESWTGANIAGGKSVLPSEQIEATCKFDIVLMDGNMPVMNGVDAVRNIRALGFTLPIVAVTGNALDDDVSNFMQAGCNHLLTKPVIRRELESCLLTFCPGFIVAKKGT